MDIKEHHLIQCNFTRRDISAQESGDKPYCYYTYDLSKNNLGFCLMAKKDNKSNKWKVSFLEVNDYEITIYEDLIRVLQTFNYIKTIKMVSLFDHLGYPAGPSLGKEVAEYARKTNAKVSEREVNTSKYTGKVKLYEREFLDVFFKLKKTKDYISSKDNILPF